MKARTGTGKTLSFALPTVERIKKDPRKVKSKGPRVLVMAPTRELACQVFREFEMLCPRHKGVAVYGGTPYMEQGMCVSSSSCLRLSVHPERALRAGVDIVVGTPGRIKDFCNKGTLSLDALE